RMGCPQRRKQPSLRRPVDADRLRLFPVRRDLQDRRSAQAAMREEQLFPKAALAAACNYRRGDSGQIGEMRMLRTGEREWNQRRAAGFNGNAKLPGNVVAKP